MTVPNVNTLWARALVDELAAAGVEVVCAAPGSRSTPLTVAVAEHEGLQVRSHLDERSAAFFALGRARVTGRPTPVITTSGTATANLHPAVLEADRARVPMLLVTADRPAELQDSGANQTVDQTKLYGDAVRSFRELADPAADARKLRSLRTTAARVVADATRPPAGPVHLNVPFRKPLEPTVETDHPPEGFADRHPAAATGRSGPFVRTATGTRRPDEATLEDLGATARAAERPLVVAGPADGVPLSPAAAAALVDALDAPLLADPLSGLRYGAHVADHPVCGAYDAVLDERVVADWPEPDLVVRVGASPTSKALRRYLAAVDARQVLVDPAGGWREATFTATDLVAAAPDHVARGVAERGTRGDPDWRAHWTDAERVARTVAADPPYFEGGLLARVTADAPAGATLFVSNSMPVRDLDRFGAPRTAPLSVHGNRGASGIDGITSTALGVGDATEGPLVVVTGDLAYYHDSNGLLAVHRCDVPATIVLVNNDGGGIFHRLPIVDHETFDAQFRTPHGLDLSATGELYDLSVTRVGDAASFAAAYEAALDRPETTVVEAVTDAADSHAVRDRLAARVLDRLTD